MAVAFRAPGAYGDRGLAGCGAPVDGSGVVAGDVLAEAVEFGALAAGQHAGAAVEFAEPGQSRGEVLAAGEGGRTRTVQGTLWLPWREKRPRGPYERMVTRSDWRSPRRVGRRRVVRRRRSPGGTVRRWREAATSVPGSQLLGGQASRSWARRGRPEGLVTVRVTSAVSPRRTEVSPERVRPRRRTGAARAASQAQARARGR